MQSSASLLGIVVMGLVGATGCGQGTSRGQEEAAAAGGQALVVSPGVTVNTATYTVSGPNGFTSAGSVPVGSSPDLSLVLTGLPLASGYELDVFATASDGVTTCEAATFFDVHGSSTTVLAHLVCGVPSGDINVSASLNICPVLDGLDVLPMEALIGGRAVLVASAHDSDGSPNPLTYKWTTNGAPLGNHPQPTLTFTCTTPGVVAIKVAASDGDLTFGCEDTLTANVTCTAP